MNTSDINHSASPQMPWHVLGAGAIGGFWALRLANAGIPVTLLTHADSNASRTLTLQDGEHFFTHSFPQQSLHEVTRISRLLVTTKTPVTAAALTPLLLRLVSGTPALLLQNGMGMDEWLYAQRPDLCVLTAITTDGVYRRDRNTLVQAGHGETLLGALQKDDEKKAQEIANDIGMTFAPDIKLRRWLKLAMNCAINPLTAHYRCRNGELLENPLALDTMRAVCKEVASVMHAEGMSIDADQLFQLTCDAARKTANNVSSMRADVEAHRETEISALNGYLVARARQHGIAAPVNTALVREIQALR